MHPPRMLAVGHTAAIRRPVRSDELPTIVPARHSTASRPPVPPSSDRQAIGVPQGVQDREACAWHLAPWRSTNTSAGQLFAERIEVVGADFARTPEPSKLHRRRRNCAGHEAAHDSPDLQGLDRSINSSKVRGYRGCSDPWAMIAVSPVTTKTPARALDHCRSHRGIREGKVGQEVGARSGKRHRRESLPSAFA